MCANRSRRGTCPIGQTAPLPVGGGSPYRAIRPRPLVAETRCEDGPVTATVMDGKAALAEILVELAARVEKLAAAGVTPGLGTLLVGEDPGSQAYVLGQAPRLREGRDRLDPARAARRRHPGRRRARDRRAQRRPGLHRLHRPAAAAAWAGRGRGAGAGRPGQGRRRAAPDEPRTAGARRGGAAAVHAARDRRSVQALRHRAGRGAGHGGRPRRDRRPSARPAAHPAQRELDGHALPHRHPRPRGRGATGRHRRGRGRGRRPDHRRHGRARRDRPRRRRHAHGAGTRRGRRPRGGRGGGSPGPDARRRGPDDAGRCC